MELLIPAVITLLAEVYKRMQTKLGKNAKEYLTIVVFGMTVIATGLYEYMFDKIEVWDVQAIIQTWGLAIGYYEIVVKRILQPIFAKK